VVFLFLPALVFAAALGIDLRAFASNAGAILGLAVVAFVLSAVLVGITLHVLLGTALVVAFLFGVLISATDPVAVVAIFRQLGVPRRLLTVVEGESLLNDGVAIVLFAILLEAATGGSISLVGGVIDFLSVFVGGAVVGTVIGLLAACVLPWLDRLPAVALSLAVAYGSFVLADEVLGFSGVLATAAAGMVLSGLGSSRATAEVREAWDQTWEALDYVANALLFLLIGLVLDPGLLADNLGAVLLTVWWSWWPAPSRWCRWCGCWSGSRACLGWGGATRRCWSGAACAAGWRWPWRWPCRRSSPSATCWSRSPVAWCWPPCCSTPPPSRGWCTGCGWTR
jgi:CPA1 family monovalent cation:H+ antiporter